MVKPEKRGGCFDTTRVRVGAYGDPNSITSAMPIYGREILGKNKINHLSSKQSDGYRTRARPTLKEKIKKGQKII